MNRRSFLSRSLLSAASFGVGSALPLGKGTRGSVFRSADGAPLPTPYPVLLIMVRGGLDPALHMVATPNGRFGNVVIANRLSGTTGIKETATGIRYAVPVVTPPGKTDFEPHLKDVALMRVFNAHGSHGYIATTWIGQFNNKDNASHKSWASQLAAQFRARGAIVPKPVAIGYWTRPSLVAEPYLDYIAWANQSPDPATVPDRIFSVKSYFDSLAAPAIPYARQAPGFTLVDTLDKGFPSGTQPDFTQRFDATNAAANAVLQNLSEPAWPLPPNVLSTFGVSESDLTSGFRLDPKFPHMFALAYQAFLKRIAHVVAFENVGFGANGGTWDSHANNLAAQTGNGNILWPTLGKLVALMKSVKSPIDGSKSLFDTTNIWVQSEMGRTITGHEPRDAKDSNRLNGTDHWPHGSALFMGGRFKRGIAIGGFTPDWTAQPINPATGKEAGGIAIRMNNIIATVMKAAGGDPTEYTSAAPIDALLDMSL